jgi:hypothetical protein
MKPAQIVTAFAAFLASAVVGAPVDHRANADGAAGARPQQPHSANTIARIAATQQPVNAAPILFNQPSVDRSAPHQAATASPIVSGRRRVDRENVDQSDDSNADDHAAANQPDYVTMLKGWRNGKRQGWLPIQPNEKWAMKPQRQLLLKEHKKLRQEQLSEREIKERVHAAFKTEFPTLSSSHFDNSYRIIFESDGRDVAWTKELDNALVAYRNYEAERKKASRNFGIFAKKAGFGLGYACVFEERYRRLIERFGERRRDPHWKEPDFINPDDGLPRAEIEPDDESGLDVETYSEDGMDRPEYVTLLNGWRNGKRQGWLPIRPNEKWAMKPQRQWILKEHRKLRKKQLPKCEIYKRMQSAFATKFPKVTRSRLFKNYRALFESDGRDVEWTKELDNALVAYRRYEAERKKANHNVHFKTFAVKAGFGFEYSSVFEERYRRLIERFGKCRRDPNWEEPDIISPSDQNEEQPTLDDPAQHDTNDDDGEMMAAPLDSDDVFDRAVPRRRRSNSRMQRKPVVSPAKKRLRREVPPAVAAIQRKISLLITG